MLQNITTLITAIIFLWGGETLLSAGDVPLGVISAGLGIVILAIRADANRRNAANPPPPEVERLTKAHGDSLAMLLIIALVYLAVVLVGRW